MDNWKQKVLRDLPLEGCTRSALKFSILASKVREREEERILFRSLVLI